MGAIEKALLHAETPGEDAELPAPLTPPDCNLQGFPFMKMDVQGLRDSDLAIQATGEEFRCALLLWCASWHQIPAASLPDDPRILAMLAGVGRDLKEWKKHEAGALRGWVKCSDGRLYHPEIAEQARKAWASKHEQRHKTECARIKKHNQRHGTRIPYPSLEEFLAQGPVHLALRDVPARSPGKYQDVPTVSPGTCPPEREGDGEKKSVSSIVDRKTLVDTLHAAGIKAIASDARLERWLSSGLTQADVNRAIEAAHARRAHAGSTQPINLGFVNRLLDDLIATRTIGASRAHGESWWETASGITAQGDRLGLQQHPDEPFPLFKERVFTASGDGPWVWKSRGLNTARGGALPPSSLRFASVAPSPPSGHPCGVPPRPTGATPPPSSVQQRHQPASVSNHPLNA